MESSSSPVRKDGKGKAKIMYGAKENYVSFQDISKRNVDDIDYISKGISLTQ